MFSVTKGERFFRQEGRPTFYLADTCWSAFTNIDEKDWDYYVDYRASQGFNVLQINMLQQWDASQTDLPYHPFERKEDGGFDFTRYNQDYFDRAGRMIKKAYERGLTVALVLIWCNYVPNTWASRMPLEQLGIFPRELLEDYVDRVMRMYDQYHPIYVISGDTDFQNDEAVEDYYLFAMNRVKKNNPNAVTTLHIRGRESALPKVIAENPNLDFVMYQSGHNRDYPEMPYQLAETFYQQDSSRPLLNSEPCYELMGYSHRAYGRFSREDIRKAAWQSVLSGASSGITYGAHGIWSWHDERFGFNSAIGEAFESPYDWRDALHFQGAWDYAFLKNIMEEYDLFDMLPAQELLRNETTEIRLAQNERYLLVYVPSNIRLKLAGDLSAWKMIYLDLDSKNKMPVQACYDPATNETCVPMHRFIGDALLIIEKK